MIKHIVKFTCWLVLFTSCGGNFVVDPIDPRLPMYTEDGNDVAGALINNQKWKSVQSGFGYPKNSRNADLTIYGSDSAVFTLAGHISKPGAEGNIPGVTVYFSFQEDKINTFSDLLSLQGQTITLDGQLNFGGISIYWEDCLYNMGVGQLYFKSVKPVTNRDDAMIISGTFGFISDTPNCGKQEVFHGRFDYVLYNNNNFQLYR
jgi:hypothetical protein